MTDQPKPQLIAVACVNCTRWNRTFIVARKALCDLSGVPMGLFSNCNQFQQWPMANNTAKGKGNKVG